MTEDYFHVLNFTVYSVKSSVYFAIGLSCRFSFFPMISFSISFRSQGPTFNCLKWPINNYFGKGPLRDPAEVDKCPVGPILLCYGTFLTIVFILVLDICTRHVRNRFCSPFF